MTQILAIGLTNVLMAGALAVIAAVVGRIARRPAVTHALWLLVLLKLITPPLVPVAISWPAPAAESTSVAAIAASAENGKPPAAPIEPAEDFDFDALADLPEGAAGHPLLEAEPLPVALPVAPPPEIPIDAVLVLPVPAVVDTLHLDWTALAGWLWLTASACWLILAMRRVRQFQKLLPLGRPAAHELQEKARTLAQKVGVRCPEVWLVPGVVAPMVWMLGRTRRLLVPCDLLGRLDPRQQSALLVHELAHIRRGDPWVRYVELAVMAIYWWCPLAWWARSELREAEEECCDAWVVWTLPEAARSYALALVETVDFLAEARPGLPATASGFGHVQTLRRRVTMIMRGNTPRMLSGPTVVVLIALGILLLPLLPSWGQQDTPEEPQRRETAKERDEIGKLAKELDRMRAALERERAELRDRQTMLEVKSRELRAMMNELKARARAAREQAKRPAATPPYPPSPNLNLQPPRYGPPPAAPHDLPRRLANVERLLAEAIHEIHELRRHVGPHAPPPPPAGGLPPSPVVPPGAQPPGGVFDVPRVPGIPPGVQAPTIPLAQPPLAAPVPVQQAPPSSAPVTAPVPQALPNTTPVPTSPLRTPTSGGKR
jgi:beta-lactamase regulating signal transducer with metallopeptidase domain